MPNENTNTASKKMTSKDMFAYHKDNFVNDERFIALDDNAKTESLSKFFDDAGVEYLTKQGLTDQAKIQAVKDQWVQKTVDSIIAPQKKKDLAIPDFGEGLLPEQEASQSSTQVVPNRDIAIEEELATGTANKPMKSVDELQSNLGNINNSIRQFQNTKGEEFKSPAIKSQEQTLEAQYQADISLGIPKEQAEMKRQGELANFMATNAYDYYEMNDNVTKAYPAIKPAMDLSEKANKLNNIYNEIQTNNGWQNLGQGAKDGIEEYLTDYGDFLTGFSSNKAITELSDKIQKIDGGENLELTEDEQLLLQTLITTSELTDRIGSELPSSYNIGKGIGGSIPFMIEFGLTSGVGSGVRKAATATGKTIAKKVAKETAKKAVNMGANLVGTLAKAGVQTAAMPTLYKDIAKNVSNGQDWGTAFGNAYYDTYTETLSENIFTGTIGGSSKGFQKVINRMGVRTAGSPANILKATGEEYLEEKFAETMHAAKDAESFEQFANQFFDAKQNLETLATVALMSGTMSVPAMGGRAMDKYSQVKFNNKYNAVSSSLPNEIKKGVDDILTNEDLTVEQANDLLGNLITSNVTSGNITEEQGIESVVNAQQYFLLSLQKKAQEGKLLKPEDTPSYKIGDQTFETKEDFLTEVEKFKGQKDVPKIDVKNDEDTFNQVTEIIKPEEKPVQQEEAKPIPTEEKIDTKKVTSIQIEDNTFDVVERDADGVTLKKRGSEESYQDLTNEEFDEIAIKQNKPVKPVTDETKATEEQPVVPEVPAEGAKEEKPITKEAVQQEDSPIGDYYRIKENGKRVPKSISAIAGITPKTTNPIEKYKTLKENLLAKPNITQQEKEFVKEIDSMVSTLEEQQGIISKGKKKLQDEGFETGRMDDHNVEFYQEETPETMSMDIISNLGSEESIYRMTDFPVFKNDGQLGIIQKNIQQHQENGEALLPESKKAIEFFNDSIKNRRIATETGHEMETSQLEEEIVIVRLRDNVEDTWQAVQDQHGDILDSKENISKFINNLSEEELFKLYNHGKQIKQGRANEVSTGSTIGEKKGNEIKKPQRTAEEQKADKLEALEADYNDKTVEELVALKKELYPNPDIESPMTDEEKLLNKITANKFSDINQAVKKKQETAKQQHNTLVAKLKEFNNTPKSHSKKRNNIRTEMDALIISLGYNYAEDKKKVAIKDQSGALIGSKAVKQSKEDIEKHKSLSEYSPEFQEFTNKALENPELLIGIEVPESFKQLQPSIKNIVKGKKTVGANNLLDFLESAYNDGIIKFKKTISTPAFSMTTEEFNQAVDEINNTEVESDNFKDVLQQQLKENNITEEEYNQLFNDYESTGDETTGAEPSEEATLAAKVKETSKSEEPKEIIALRQKQSDLEKELALTKKQKTKALAEAQDRNGLFGDVKADANELFPETFEVNKETIDKIKKPFDAKIATLEREIEVTKKTIESGKKELAGQTTIKSENEVANILKDVAAKIRQGKLNKPGELKMGVGFDLIWDASLEVLATTLEVTSDIVTAVNAALKHMQNSEWYKGLSERQQKKADKTFSRTVTEFIGKEKVRGEKLPAEIKADIDAQNQRIAERNTKMIKNIWDKARADTFDNKKAISILQEAIVYLGGKVTERTDVHAAENLSHSKAQNVEEKFNEKHAQPLLKLIAKVATNAKLSTKSISLYLMAKHAPERNQMLADRELSDYETKLIKSQLHTEAEIEAKVTKRKLLLDEKIKNGSYNKSGMSTPEAKKTVKQTESRIDKAELDELQQAIKLLTNRILDLQLEYQLINQETYDSVKKMYQNYVPLRGWDKTADSEFVYRDASSEAMAARTPLTKGRTSLADDPIANLFNMTSSIITEGEKNRVKLRMKRLLAENKDFIKAIASFRVTYKVMREVEITKDGKTTKEDVEIDEFHTKKEIPEKYIDSGYKIVTNVNTSTKASKTESKGKQHEVHLMENGNRVIIQFDDPQVALALNNKDSSNALESATAAANKWVKPMTSIISGFFTSRNPAFVIPNTLRDFMLANTVHYVQGGLKQAALFNKNYALIQKALMLKTDETSTDKYRQMRVDFNNMGALTGYSHLKNVEQLKKEIANDVKAMQGNKWQKAQHALKTPLKSTFKVLDKMAAWSEGLSRFATYVTSLEIQASEIAKEKGITFEEAMKKASKQKAALAAKNVTVNFDKKGRYAGFIGSFYAFFNASLQGVNLYSKLWATDWKRMSVAHITFMATGFLSAMLTDLIGGDDDDELLSDGISDYTKYNHFIIPFGDDKEFIKLPMPHIFRMFHGAGSMAYEIMKEMGRVEIADVTDKEKSQMYEDAIMQRLQYFVSAIPQDFLPTDVTGILDDKGKLNYLPIIPTFAKPVFELIKNENFMGLPIYKRPFTADLERKNANSQQYFKSVNPLYKDGTNWMFKMAGGDVAIGKRSYINEKGERKEVPRALDINPEWVEHMIQGYFGGTGKFVQNVAQTVYSVVADDEINMDKFPVVHRFIGDAGYDRQRQMYQTNREEVDLWFDLYDAYVKKRDVSSINLMRNSPNYNKAYMFKNIDEVISDRMKLLKNPKLSDADRETIKKDIQTMTKEANQALR